MSCDFVPGQHSTSVYPISLFGQISHFSKYARIFLISTVEIRTKVSWSEILLHNHLTRYSQNMVLSNASSSEWIISLKTIYNSIFQVKFFLGKLVHFGFCCISSTVKFCILFSLNSVIFYLYIIRDIVGYPSASFLKSVFVSRFHCFRGFG